MGRFKTNYNDIVIYKIVCNDKTINDFYVGYTTNYGAKKYTHKTESFDVNALKKTKNIKLYNLINNNGGWFNWHMQKIENFSCDNSDQARARVKYWKKQIINNEENNKNTKLMTYDELLLKYNKLIVKYWKNKMKNKQITYKDESTLLRKFNKMKEKHKQLKDDNHKMKEMLINNAFLDGS